MTLPTPSHDNAKEGLTDTKPKWVKHPLINGGLKCPACGSTNTIFLAEGNYLTCSWIECPEPDYADAVKASATARVREALQQQLDEILEWSKFGARNRMGDSGRRAIADLHEYRSAKLSADTRGEG